MSEMKRTPSKPSFESIDEAFNYCREKDQPVTVILDDTVQGYYGIYKLYPSGRADQIRRCICNQVDNHTHGMDQFVDWRAERKHRQLEAAPEMEELLRELRKSVVAFVWEPMGTTGDESDWFACQLCGARTRGSGGRSPITRRGSYSHDDGDDSNGVYGTAGDAGSGHGRGADLLGDDLVAGARGA